MIAFTVYLGWQLFFGQKGPEDIRTAPEIMKVIRTLNFEGKDMSIVGEFHKLTSRLQKEVDNKKLTKEESDKLTFEAKMLVAQTQFNEATRRKDFNRVLPAQISTAELNRASKKTPFWTQPVSVVADPASPAVMQTADNIVASVRKEAAKLGKESLVWGFFPGYQMIDGLVNFTGRMPAFSYVFAAFLLACVVRAVVWPLTAKTYKFSRQMGQLSPLIAEIKTEFKDRPQEMNVRMMGLYKEYGVNPMAGCAPAMLQMPLFFLVYQSMLHYRYEFENGTFLWVNQATSDSSKGFFAPNLGERDVILVIIYGVSMIISTMLQPISDPANARQQRLMGIGISVLFTIFMFTGVFPVPAAFVLYWIFTNVLTTAQSIVSARQPLQPLMQVNAPNGGVYPGSLGTPKKSTGAPQVHKPKKKK